MTARNIGDLDDRSLAEAIERKRRLLVIATGEGRDDIEDEHTVGASLRDESAYFRAHEDESGTWLDEGDR